MKSISKSRFVQYLRDQCDVLNSLANDIEDGNLYNSEEIWNVDLDKLNEYLDCSLDIMDGETGHLMSENKFIFFNDTGRAVSIHPATIAHGIACDESNIEHLQTRTFILPEGTYPWVKMWDYGEGHGLQILVSYAKE